MFWKILPHASACITGDRVLLLDVRQDRYLLVPVPLENEVQSWLSCATGRAAPPEFTELLRKSGTLRSADPEPGNVHRETIVMPETLAARATPIRPPVLAIARTWGLTLSTSVALRRRTLAALLIPAHDGGSSGDDTVVQSNLAQTFDAARSFVPIERRCLLDSLALRRWLEIEGQHVRLVFGVKEAPFSAHCWLQNETAILNDHYDRVSRFTPILAV